MVGEKGAWEGWMGATDTLRGRKLEWLNAMGIVCRLSTARERVGCSRGGSAARGDAWRPYLFEIGLQEK